jgi:hypothetical protein
MGAQKATRIALTKQYRPEYVNWKNMMARCRNPRVPMWKHYGGRGIVVCDHWKVFANFLDDMGVRPSSDHQIERLDDDGHYEPGNCVWATAKEQQANTSKVRFLTYNGVTLSLSDWSLIFGISAEVIRQRLNTMKWPIEQALRTPVRKRSKPTQPLTQP